MIAWIAVDFDETLVEATPGFGFEPRGLMPMVSLVRDWIEYTDRGGPEVRIFTARVSLGEEYIAPVREWSLRTFGRVLAITNVKDPYCIAIYDNLAFGVEANTGRLKCGRHDA